MTLTNYKNKVHDKLSYDKLNKLGFSKASYNEETAAPVIPTSIRKQILSSIPKHYNTSWKYYIDGFLYLTGYLSIFITTWYYQYKYSVAYYRNKDIMNRIKYILLSPIYAWSMTGYLLVGHVAVHGALAPKGTLIGSVVNDIMSFLTFDLTFFSSWIWNREHTKHHKNVNVAGTDDMHIRGSNIVTEQLWALSIVIRYTYYDIYELCFNWNITNKRVLLRKVKIVCGSYFRFNYVLWRFLNRDWCLLFFNLSSTLVVFNYIGFLAHSRPVRSKGKTNDYFIWAMRETWDIFPKSSFMNFLHCGIGAHCSHHICPYLPHSLSPIVSDALSTYCKDEYRVIDTFRDELWLWWNRHSSM